MKRLILIFGIFLTVFTACQEDQVAPSGDQNPTNQKSEAAKEVLNIISGMKGFDRLGFGSPSVFTGGFGLSSTGSVNGRQLSTARMQSDTTDNGGGDGGGGSGEGDDHFDGECEWTSCAEQTFTENADGSFTWILDYGTDGCEEYGYTIKGKIIETYKEDGNTFTSSIEYVNFGDDFYLMNGTSSYSGTWSEPDFGAGEDTLMFSYSGSYTYAEDLMITTKDSVDGVLVEETIKLEASGSESYDEKGSTTNEGFSKYTLSNGDFYNTTISTPLYYSFECDTDLENGSYVFVYVSGVESTSWQEGTESGEFSVNYGDGTCDNIITVTENGESYDVDLGEEWEDDWEEGEDANG